MSVEPAGSATRRGGGDGGGGDRGKFSAEDTLPTNMGVIITDHGAYAPDSPSKADVGGGLTAEQKAANAAREHYDLGLRLLHIAETTFEAPAIYSPFIKFSSVRSVAESAADAFLMAGKFRKAAQAMALCGNAEKSMGHGEDAAFYFAQAGEVAARVDHESAVEYYTMAMNDLVVVGKFAASALMQVRIGALCEEDNAVLDAGRSYSYAGELFLSAEDRTQAVWYLNRGGAFCALAYALEEAARIFEKAAEVADSDNMMRYHVPVLLFDAALCTLGTGDIPGAEDFIVASCKAHPTFYISKYRRFLFDIIHNTKQLEVHAFLDHVWNMDHAHVLRPHELRILQRIHRMFEVELSDLSTKREQEEERLRLAARRKVAVAGTGAVASAAAGGATAPASSGSSQAAGPGAAGAPPTTSPKKA